jgi:hypothetical protein
MPMTVSRPSLRPTRLRALIAAVVAAAACAAALPPKADAYTEDFCQYTGMWPGQNCYAGNRHTLQAVYGWTINSSQRICAASFTAPYGLQNSDWRCDYAYTEKLLYGRVDGVGGIHNGDPYGFYGYARQEF